MGVLRWAMHKAARDTFCMWYVRTFKSGNFFIEAQFRKKLSLHAIDEYSTEYIVVVGSRTMYLDPNCPNHVPYIHNIHLN